MRDTFYDKALQGAMHILENFPRTVLIASITIFVLLVTRIYSTIRFRSQLAHTARSTQITSPPEPPHSIPYLANGTYFANLLPNLTSLAKTHPQVSVFSFKIASSRHNVVMAPSMMHQMAVNTTVIPKLDLGVFIHRSMEYFWNDGRRVRNAGPTAFHDIHKPLSTMMHSTFINNSLPPFSDAISRSASDLITFSNSIVDQLSWERAAAVQTLSSTTVTANLFSLIRQYTAQHSTDILFCTDLLHNYPNILSDLFLLDTKFEAFLAGFPQWLPSSIGPARARDRIAEAFRQHSLAFWKFHNGIDPGTAWSNIDQTSQPMKERVLASARAGDFDPSLPEHKQGWLSAYCNAAILWASQIQAPTATFWMIFYIYRDPTLLAAIRREIAPYVQLSSTDDNNTSPIPTKPALTINAPLLRSSAKLLLSTLHEVLRVETFSLTYKQITADFTLTESPEDALLAHGSAPKTFHLHKGEYVVYPHTLHHADSRYFSSPEEFNPYRFLTPKDASKSNGGFVSERARGPAKTETDMEKGLEGVEVSYLTTHPWGGGHQLCKGKKFAEGEILVAVAAIVAMWDITPVDGAGGKGWKHPGRAALVSTARPAQEVRVKIERRRT